MSLRLKILFLLFITCIGGGYWSFRWLEDQIRPQFLRVMEDGMVDQAYLLTKLAELSLPEKIKAKDLSKLQIRELVKKVHKDHITAKIYEWEKEKVRFRVYITDHKGIVRLDTDNDRDLGKNYSQWNDVKRALKGEYGARSSEERNSSGKLVDSLYVAFPIKKRNKIIGTLTLCKAKRSLSGWANRAEKKLWRSVFWGVTAIFLLALLMSNLILRPIFRLTQYVRDVTEGRRVQPPPQGHDEIGELTCSFLEMKEALLERQDLERFVTQLTHELKSPISAIRGAAELLEDQEMPLDNRLHFLGNIQSQTQRMNDIVQRLLQLVAVEQQEELEKSDSIDVCDLLRDLKELFLPQAQQRRLTIFTEQETDGPFIFIGDRFLLEQALSNLLQNSMNFTPPEGEVILRIQKRSGRLELFVMDTGTGIPDYAVDRVTERFYSLEHPNTGAKGTGLGLPFVRQVALLHGGDFLLENREPKGTKAYIWFPLHNDKF